MTRGERDVLREREWQRTRWGDKNDDAHAAGELESAARVMLGDVAFNGSGSSGGPVWAFRLRNKHAQDRRRQIVIGIALALAALDRLDRATDHKEATP